MACGRHSFGLVRTTHTATPGLSPGPFGEVEHLTHLVACTDIFQALELWGDDQERCPPYGVDSRGEYGDLMVWASKAEVQLHFLRPADPLALHFL